MIDCFDESFVSIQIINLRTRVSRSGLVWRDEVKSAIHAAFSVLNHGLWMCVCLLPRIEAPISDILCDLQPKFVSSASGSTLRCDMYFSTRRENFLDVRALAH